MRVQADRLWSLLEDVNQFGAIDSGGVERLAWTEPELAARRWIADRCRDEGLDVEFDEAGNVWALSGTKPAVFLGSHLDTVRNAGRFDGALGITAALAVIGAARRAGTPGADRLGLVCFGDEEGVRFGTGMTGSRAVAGDLSPDELASAMTTEGVSLADEMTTAGFDPHGVARASARRADMAAYLELHVEQGRRLERAAEPVGIVTGIVGLSHWRVEVHGEANHAGTTLPDDRRDALVPLAAAVIEAAETMNAMDGVVATVGEAAVPGGAMNIIPGRARFTLDVRSLDEGALEVAHRRIISAAENSAAARGCKVEAVEVKRLTPARMADSVLAVQRRAAARLDVSAPEMPSMAGHDAMTLTKGGVLCGMVFVRSQGGVSHSPEEYSTPDDCALGAELLALAALDLAARL
jgi:allantoate deiminase